MGSKARGKAGIRRQNDGRCHATCCRSVKNGSLTKEQIEEAKEHTKT